MPRITKDPQTRITEIMDTAERMFATRGYQETQISDIVKAIGASQGIFYYYFKSKEEVVEAIVKRNMMQVLAQIENAMNSRKMNAPEKIVIIVRIMLNHIQTPNGLLFEFLHDDQQLHILEKISRHLENLLIPLLQQIVDDGVVQGEFNVLYPREAVDFILAVIRCLWRSLYKDKSTAVLAHRMLITQQLLESALGAEKGILNLSNGE